MIARSEVRRPVASSLRCASVRLGAMNRRACFGEIGGESRVGGRTEPCSRTVIIHHLKGYLR